MRKNIVFLAMCQALGMSMSSMLLSSAGLVGESLASDPKWATLPLSAQFLFTMFTTLPASLLMQRKGRRFGFIFACVVMMLSGTGAALAIYSGYFYGFVASAMGMGIAIGFFQYFRFAAIDIAPAKYASRAVSWVLAGGLLAAFIGPNLAALTRAVDAAHPFMITMLCAIPLSLIMIFIFWHMDLPLPTAEEMSGQRRPLGVIIRQPVFVVAVVSAMIAYSVMTLLMTATPLAMKAHGFGFGQTAFIIQWHLVGMFAPSFFSGALMNRFGILPVMLLGVIAYLVVVLINFQTPSMASYWMALVLLGIGWNFLFIGATTLLHEAWTPAEKGRVQGINDTLVFSMSSIAAMSSGLLQASIGWKAINLVSLPVSALAGGLIVFIMLQRRRNAIVNA